MRRSEFRKTILLLLFLNIHAILLAQWVRFEEVVAADLKGLYFFDELSGVMVGRDSIGGNRGKIFHTSDGGSSWRVAYHDTSVYHWIDAVDFTSTGLGMAASRSEVYYRSTDFGLTWDTVSHPGVPVQHETMEMVDQNVGYTGNSRGEILKTTDGGLSWSVQFTFSQVWHPILDISCTDTENCYASSTNGTFRTTNGGATWQYLLAKSFGEIHCWDALNCIGVSEQTAETWRTRDGGQTWHSAALPEGYRGKCIAMKGAEGYVGGEYESIYHTLDSGNTWTLVHYLPGTNIFDRVNSIFLLDAKKGFACANGRTFYRLGFSGGDDTGPSELAHVVFPNPMIDQSRFVFSEILESGTYHLYDVRGKILRKIKFGDASEFTFEDLDLPPALYGYVVTSDNFPPVSGKLLKR